MSKYSSIKSVIAANKGYYARQPVSRVLGNGETQVFGEGFCVHVSGEGYIGFTGAYADNAKKHLTKARAIGPVPRTNTSRTIWVAL